MTKGWLGSWIYKGRRRGKGDEGTTWEQQGDNVDIDISASLCLTDRYRFSFSFQ